MGIRSTRNQPKRVARHRSDSIRLLHVLSGLVRLNQQLQRTSPPRGGSLHERRRRQRSELVKQLVQAGDIFRNFKPIHSGWWLWKGLRWGGPGVLIGWWLAQAATG